MHKVFSHRCLMALHFPAFLLLTAQDLEQPEVSESIAKVKAQTSMTMQQINSQLL